MEVVEEVDVGVDWERGGHREYGKGNGQYEGQNLQLHSSCC